MLLKSLHERVKQALYAAQDAGELQLETLPDIHLEIPRDTSHGDYATNVALGLAKPARMAPRKIAELLVKHLAEDPLFESVSIAGPGFINFRLSWQTLYAGVTQVNTEQAQFGQQPPTNAHRYLIEFVSANPTGPLHFGHGRWAVLGDCLARLMRTAGYTVNTEFYINDTGSQIQNLGASVQATYLHHLKKQGVTLSAHSEGKVQAYYQEKADESKTKVSFYHGSYIEELGAAMYAEYGTELQDQPVAFFCDHAKNAILKQQQAQMEAFGVHFDEWYPESRLHGEGAIQAGIEALTNHNSTYESEGALWFRSSDYGDDKDRVLIKSGGSSTYFANDVAYHHDKLQRGFDRLINIWGADHHGYVARVQAAIQALGHPPEALHVILGQIVHLYRNGEQIRMSKRTGEMVTFEEVFEEVGKDATRYLLMQRSPDSTIDFDLELAKNQSSDNPVFYVQYAHARICSIFRTAQQSEILKTFEGKLGEANLDLLGEPEARRLILKILSYPDELIFAAHVQEPHRLTTYAQELAAAFHSFYKQCRVLDESQPELSLARLALAQATRQTLHNLLTGIFGISAPESM